MNERELILRAADQIERQPERFCFQSIGVPHIGGKGMGCALGWIAAHGGHHYEFGGYSYGAELIGVDTTEFYQRMNGLAKKRDLWDWTRSAGVCANRMWRYADKYHPDPTQEHLQKVSWQDCVWKPAKAVVSMLVAVAVMIGLR